MVQTYLSRDVLYYRTPTMTSLIQLANTRLFHYISDIPSAASQSHLSRDLSKPLQTMLLHSQSQSLTWSVYGVRGKIRQSSVDSKCYLKITAHIG